MFIGASSAWWLPCGRPLSAANRGQQCPRLPFLDRDLRCGPTRQPCHQPYQQQLLPGYPRDVMVLCNVLASFLRGSRGGTLYGVGNIVGSVPIGSASEDF